VNKRLIALLAVVGVLAAAPACGQRDEKKLTLTKLLQESAHSAGVFRYSDQTPQTPFGKATLAQVRGLVEDDFRYKARLTVDGADAIDEVVNDDALAVRFLDPSFVEKFTTRGGDRDIRAALSARYWVTDPVGAPSIGDAAVADRTIGIDPIVDSLSVIDYAVDAVAASGGVDKFNPEGLNYRPKEDPFPRPAQGSGVTRWDVYPPDMPRADALDTGQISASLARTPVFRKMAVYVKDGRVVQIREEIGARFELLDKFYDYILKFTEKGDKRAAALLKKDLDPIKDQPDLLAAVLNFALNELLRTAGEDPVRFRSMKYEFSRTQEKPAADLPFGPDVRVGSLSFFGVNSKSSSGQTTRTSIVDTEATTTTSPASPTTVP
jgi:hypothetical protein